MNVERAVLRGVFAAVLVGTVCAAAALDKAPDKPAAAPKSLIRKEWLRAPAEPLVPPRRDIFSPQAASSVDEGGVPFRPGQPGAVPTEKKVEEEARPAFALRYIGYSRALATKKIVALVMIESQAQAIEEGDMVGAGYKVARITLKEIEIQAPDGTILTFVLVEGAE